MENNNVSFGASPGERSILLLSQVSAGGMCEGCLTRHWVAESVSAVMRASMGLNWLQLKTCFYCCGIRFQIATTFPEDKKCSTTLHRKAANARSQEHWKPSAIAGR
jgi:hypothetical protein